MDKKRLFMELTEDLKNEYLDHWTNYTINSTFVSALKHCADEIEKHRTIYEEVSKETGVPWYVIAVIHSMEASFNFGKHLHNGNPLTARTVDVPKGRPKKGTPPFTWQESAIDALSYDGATSIETWNIPIMFWFLEGFNGWGYRTGEGRNTTPNFRSPYIYSGTTYYEKGKYVKDGSSGFDPNFVSKQVGCMAQLKELENRGLISFRVQGIDQNTIGSVAAWQHILNGCGYYPVLFINDNSDTATVAATKKFQKDVGLPETGTVDLNTWQVGFKHQKLPGWSAVVPEITTKHNPEPPTDGTIDRNIVGSVAAWQHILNGCGYTPLLSINGWMDEATVATTQKFQKDVGLLNTGTVDLNTWQAGFDHDKVDGWIAVIPSISDSDNSVPNVTISKLTTNLFNFYSEQKNYNAVHNDVMKWFGTRKNACVAFASSALRLSGYPVPKTNLDGANISLWTVAFSEYLASKGWKKETNASKLQKGDIVFTEEGGFGAGVPAHVYVFAGWEDQPNQIAWVIDNQGFTHRRNINKGGGGFNFTPFDYFLRA
jgi:lysozyme family protein